MVGREKEIRTLNKLCQSNESKLAVVYGRRRVGKTYLIENMFKENHNCIYFSFTGAYNGDTKTQLANFSEAIYDWFKTEIEPTTNWTEAFIALKRILSSKLTELSENGKIVLFIDEIPWIDRTNKTDFSAALGHFWNTFCITNKRSLMILCGSNASWIKNKILEEEQGPHHKRVDKIIPIMPFTLRETAQYLKEVKNLHIDNKTITEIYMIFGGVAKYLSYYDPELSLPQNVNEIFFSLHGPLYKEYEMLFKSLFVDKDNTYKNTIKELIEKRSGLTTNQIAHELKFSPTSPKLRNTISDLVACGFIKPLSKKGNERDAKFIISDPFILFYHKWVLPLSKNDLVASSEHWQNMMISDTYPKWTGFAFEMVCIVNIEEYLIARGMNGSFKSLSYWNHIANTDIEGERGAQIDILVEYKNDCYDIVECKYYNDEVEINAALKTNIINKMEMFKKYGLNKKKFDIKTIFISPYGVKKNGYYMDVPIFNDYQLDIFFR